MNAMIMRTQVGNRLSVDAFEICGGKSPIELLTQGEGSAGLELLLLLAVMNLDVNVRFRSDSQQPHRDIATLSSSP